MMKKTKGGFLVLAIMLISLCLAIPAAGKTVVLNKARLRNAPERIWTGPVTNNDLVPEDERSYPSKQVREYKDLRQPTLQKSLAPRGPTEKILAPPSQAETELTQTLSKARQELEAKRQELSTVKQKLDRQQKEQAAIAAELKEAKLELLAKGSVISRLTEAVNSLKQQMATTDAKQAEILASEVHRSETRYNSLLTVAGLILVWLIIYLIRQKMIIRRQDKEIDQKTATCSYLENRLAALEDRHSWLKNQAEQKQTVINTYLDRFVIPAPNGQNQRTTKQRVIYVVKGLAPCGTPVQFQHLARHLNRCPHCEKLCEERSLVEELSPEEAREKRIHELRDSFQRSLLALHNNTRQEKVSAEIKAVDVSPSRPAADKEHCPASEATG